MYMCWCVSERERDRETEIQRERERDSRSLFRFSIPAPSTEDQCHIAEVMYNDCSETTGCSFIGTLSNSYYKTETEIHRLLFRMLCILNNGILTIWILKNKCFVLSGGGQ